MKWLDWQQKKFITIFRAEGIKYKIYYFLFKNIIFIVINC